MKCALALCFSFAAAALLSAQDRDYLTPNEVDQVREARTLTTGCLCISSLRAFGWT